MLRTVTARRRPAAPRHLSPAWHGWRRDGPQRLPVATALCLALVSLPGCTSGGDPDLSRASGTLEMAATLQRIHQAALADPVPYFNLNRRRVELIRRELAQAGLGRRADVRLFFAIELLSAGDEDAAIRELESLLPRPALDLAVSSRTRPLLTLLGTALLRQGERRNCRGALSADACILPISQDAPYAWQDASREAIALYGRLLTSAPDDFQARWLLNLAYLTVGEYPDGVPERWRIPGLARPATPRLPRFRNLAPALRVAVDGMAGGVSLEDFNGDGFTDIFVTAYGLNDQVRLFLADGRGGFEDRTGAAGLDGIVGGLNTVHADYDNDGDVDILVLRGAWLGAYGAHPNSLLRNNGDGTFEDVTAAAGLLSFHPTQTAAWGDFNNDGRLDLFIGNESGGQFQGMGAPRALSDAPGSAEEHPSELFVNNGDGTFTEQAALVGIDLRAFVKGAAWGDVNNDGRPDLYASVLGGDNRLYVNQGGSEADGWRFVERGAAAGVQQPLMSFPCWFWDFDNDGWEDLFVASYDFRTDAPSNAAREFLGLPVEGDRTRVFRNNGDGTFTDVAPAVGLDGSWYVMGANTGDVDNDGYPDLYLGTGAPDPRATIPNRLFLNHAGTRFEDVTFAAGLGHLAKGHGIAFADLDQDGDRDIYAVMGGAVEGDAFPNALFENPGPSPANAWVTLELEGRTANRSAIGARIAVTVEDRSGARRTVHATVSTGGSFGASSLRQEMGLGAAVRIVELRITWPNRARSVDVHVNLVPNRHYHVVEGMSADTLPRGPVRLGGDTRAPGSG